MPVITSSTSVAASSVNDNLLSGSQFEFLPFNAGLEFGINGDANGADMRVDVYSGQDVLMENAPLNVQNRLPVYPDDFTLVDVALVANLLLIIIFAGYENFVSKINTGDSEDRPDWMGHVSFSDLKLKVIGSIVAISGIELLKAFVNIEAYTNQQLGWKVGLHMAFVVSGVMFALMDKLTSGKPGH